MKKTLLALLVSFCALTASSQTPAISGDTLLCPNGSGSASIDTDQAYDTYQWYWRDAFTSDPYVAINGETTASIEYTAAEYSLKQIRVVTTLGEEEYTSNALIIDSQVFLPIFTMSEDVPNVSIVGEGNLALCVGTTFDLTVGSPYTINIQWFKNGVAIPGENSPTLTVGTAGEYYVTAAPQGCPGSAQTSLSTVVVDDTECNLGLPQNENSLSFVSFPNPVQDALQFTAAEPIESLKVYNVAGQTVLQAKPNAMSGSLDTNKLAAGIYLLEAKSASFTKTTRIIKN